MILRKEKAGMGLKLETFSPITVYINITTFYEEEYE
jgi:hypothetical protein